MPTRLIVTVKTRSRQSTSAERAVFAVVDFTMVTSGLAWVQDRCVFGCMFSLNHTCSTGRPSDTDFLRYKAGRQMKIPDEEELVWWKRAALVSTETLREHRGRDIRPSVTVKRMFLISLIAVVGKH
ncbi:hypothetical protein MHYP_G00168800 [Metynnis hypsauchen]